VAKISNSRIIKELVESIFTDMEGIRGLEMS
jgi:hypothetical protein